MKVHYRINKGRDGLPMNYEGARHFHNVDAESVSDHARKQLAMDYQVPETEIEISRVEHV